MYHFELSLQNGEGIIQKIDQEKILFHKAALLGHPYSMYQYDMTIKVIQNFEECEI
jgi:hypothetical protein